MTTTRGSGWARRVATVLLDSYPRRWRVRYGVEMRALVDAMPVTWRQVGDLGIGAVREWLSSRAVGWPARSAAGRVNALRLFGYLLVTAGIEGVVHATVTPRSNPGLLELMFVLLLVAAALRLGLGFWYVTNRSLVRAGQKPGWVTRQRWLGPARAPEVLFWFGAIAVWIAFDHASPIPRYVRDPTFHSLNEHLRPLLWTMWLYWSSDRTVRLRRIEFARLRRAAAITQLELFKLPSRLD